MTGTTKRSSKFSLFLAVLALGLCLAVTACSSDGTVKYSSDTGDTPIPEAKSVLEIILGRVGAVTPKGFDVDANATKFTVTLLDSTSKPIGERATFVENSSNKATEWTELANGSLRLALEVEPKYVHEVTAFSVTAYDHEDTILGVVFDDAVELLPGQITTTDFTADSARPFRPLSYFGDQAFLLLTTEPEYDKGLLTLKQGETARVFGQLVIDLNSQYTIYEPLDPRQVELSVSPASTADIDNFTNIILAQEDTGQPVPVTGVASIGDKRYYGRFHLTVLWAGRDILWEPEDYNVDVMMGTTLPFKATKRDGTKLNITLKPTAETEKYITITNNNIIRPIRKSEERFGLEAVATDDAGENPFSRYYSIKVI